MEKEEIIDILISNSEISGWTEDDRATLEASPMGALTRCLALAEQVANAMDDDEDEDDEEEPPRKKKMEKARRSKVTNKFGKDEDNDDDLGADEADEEDGQAVQRDLKGKKRTFKGGRVTGLQDRTILKRDLATNEEEEDEADQRTLNEYLDASGMPPEYREVVEAGMQVWNDERNRYIDFIFNHENNEFTKEYLREQKMPVLQGLVQALGGMKQSRRVHYAGAGPAVTPLRNQVEEEPLMVPTMNWATKD